MSIFREFDNLRCNSTFVGLLESVKVSILVRSDEENVWAANQIKYITSLKDLGYVSCF